MEQTLWVEKYRPMTIDECVIPDKLRRTLKGFISSGELPNLMFTGTQGTGKTTLAKAIVRELGAESIFIDASTDNGKMMIQEQIVPFASTVSIMNPDAPKFVICDECLEENHTIRIGTTDSYEDVPLNSLQKGQWYSCVSMNMETGEFENDQCFLCTDKTDDLFIVKMSNGVKIRCNSNHPFVILLGKTYVKKRVIDGGLVGKMCRFTDGTFAKIEEITDLGKKGRVMDVHVIKNHTFITDGGLVTSNCDYLTPSAQASLRPIIEKYSATTRFIFTGNYPQRLIPALKSRCTHFDMSITKTDKMELVKTFFDRCKMILDENNVDFNSKVLGKFILKHFPDFRKVINELQSYSSGGEGIDEGILTISAGSIADSLYPLIKEKNFEGCRQWLAESVNSPDDIFSSLYSSMFEHVEAQNQPELILILAQYQDSASRVSNQEINLMACFVEMMSSVGK